MIGIAAIPGVPGNRSLPAFNPQDRFCCVLKQVFEGGFALGPEKNPFLSICSAREPGSRDRKNRPGIDTGGGRMVPSVRIL